MDQLLMFKIMNNSNVRFNLQIRIYGVTCVYTGYWLLTMGFSLCKWEFIDTLHDKNWQIFITFLIFNVISSIVFWAFIPSTKQKSYKDIFDRLNC